MEITLARLKEILDTYLAESVNQATPSRTRLKKELTAYRNRLFWSFLTIMIGVIALAGFSAYLISRHQECTNQSRAWAGALGISSGGCFELARRLWVKWARIGLITLLIEDAPEAVLQTVMKKLVPKL